MPPVADGVESVWSGHRDGGGPAEPGGGHGGPPPGVCRFLDAVNFVAGNPEADPEQELSDRWVVEQMSELTAMTASFVLATPTETDGALFPGRIMLANTCMWDYRGDECGYNGPAVADEFDNPTTDIRKDRCSKCMRGCEMRGMVANFGGFLSINKLSQ